MAASIWFGEADPMRIESITLSPHAELPTAPIRTGISSGPGVPALGVDNVSLLRNGLRWLGVMGEIHYSRVDPTLWEAALSRMKAGGLDLVASYVFWIHHEEVEGEFDFTGSRNLRRFVQTCAHLGLPAMIRIGPWCHGEVRNGGLPDWVLDRQPRTIHEPFLDSVRRLYTQVAGQLEGLLWRDGGPVLGVQLDNEFGGPAEYLLELKRIAREVGLDVPFYTRTGWPSTSTPMPFGEMLPLYGAYAEGFWDRELVSMPGHYWKAFCFESLRTDIQIGMDQLGERPASDDIDTPQYPYLTCELGGGMETSYHRRLLIDPLDVLATAVVKVGSGSNLPGYYMFHGGVNPRGKLTTLQESQATRYWNDLATANYDFQAPLGSFGQVRPSYHLLRRLHLFLNEFGSQLAEYRVQLPLTRPEAATDLETLRWAIRTDGRCGFLFANNHQRGVTLSAKRDVQFRIQLHDGTTLCLPSATTSIPSDAVFVWPFNLDLGHATLGHATAQLVCTAGDVASRTFFFVQTPGIDAEFAFRLGAEVSLWRRGERETKAVLYAQPDARQPVCELRHRDGRTIRIVLLDDEDSLRLFRVRQDGREYVVCCDADVRAASDGTVCLQRLGGTTSAVTLQICPSPGSVLMNGHALAPTRGEVFNTFRGQLAAFEPPRELVTRQVRRSGPPRSIALGSAGVAEAPSDEDFEAAAVFELELPPDLDRLRALLRFTYVGDVIRVIAAGRLVLDGFYHGRPLELAMHLIPDGTSHLQIQILPLQKAAPIYIDAGARPDWGEDTQLARLDRVEAHTLAEATVRIASS